MSEMRPDNVSNPNESATFTSAFRIINRKVLAGA